MSRDHVFVRDLRLRTVIGIGARERARLQEVAIDVTAFYPAQRAGRSDDPADILDYGALAEAVRAHVTTTRSRLLEALAEGIADLVLARFAAERVVVRVAKPGAVPGAAAAGVEIDRRRPRGRGSSDAAGASGSRTERRGADRGGGAGERGGR